MWCVCVWCVRFCGFVLCVCVCVCGVCVCVCVCVWYVFACTLCMCSHLWSIRNLPHSGCFAANCSAVCLSLFRRSLRAPMLCKWQQHRVRNVAPYQTQRRCVHQRYDCISVSSTLVVVAQYLRQSAAHCCICSTLPVAVQCLRWYVVVTTRFQWRIAFTALALGYFAPPCHVQ